MSRDADLIADQQDTIDMLRERIRQLEEVLAPSVFAPPLEFRLTPQEARIFAHLASRPRATKESVMLALYSDRPDEQPEIKIVDVFVCKLRRKLKPFGVSISTLWGLGYALDDRERFAGGAL